MSPIPTVLQGTDGIRGQVHNTPDLGTGSALQYYLETGFLTPSFFELYTYSFALLLKSEGGVKNDDYIVIGWDPRDKSGSFTKAACDGVRKAGLGVFSVGNLPTPAIPLYMLSRQAVGSIVLTASHNPADQNGIKLFHGFTALKFLPPDDLLLTKKVTECQQLDLSSLPLQGELINHSQQAKELFVSFCLEADNSWLGKANFDDTILVIDASKGAVAQVAKEVFSGVGCSDVIFTNLGGDINQACGIADIEGEQRIKRESVFGKSGQWQGYETLITLFNEAQNKPEIAQGTLRLVGLVFDGDGDRCYRLDYLPMEDELVISSGDFLGIHQARYLKKKRSPGLFVNTVESDLNVAITAEELGYQAVLTGVGDKWILLKAILDVLKTQPNQNKQLIEHIKALEKGQEVTGLEISRLVRKLAPLKVTTDSQYSLGLEDSGHCITLGSFKQNGETASFFGGNGIKTGINALVAMQGLALVGENSISTPYPAGVKKTYYIYYVNKSLLEAGMDFRSELTGYLTRLVEDTFSKEYQGKIVEFPEESSMLFCKITKADKLTGSVFIRNSGTEDKSALYLRGDRMISEELAKIGSELHGYLLKNLKDKSKEIAQLESKILQAIDQQLSLEPLTVNHPSLPVERVLKEMHLKQGLIAKDGIGWTLTDQGSSLI
jgi:phosphomannomutase